MTASEHRSLNDLLAECLRLQQQVADLEQRLKAEQTAHLSWMDCSVELATLLEQAESNVRALLAANAELQATVKGLCRNQELSILTKRKGVQWTH